jgi:8-oxo-dGTP pyrophosphatase MutT (NUDIX family)
MAEAAKRVPDDNDWVALIGACLRGSRPVHEIEEWRLSGLPAAQSLRLRTLFPANPVPAAVLVPIVERPGGATVLLTQRATHLKNHAGQISFPGGRMEPSDPTPLATALRETEEEIGLAPGLVRVAGYLPDHLIVSGYRVTPVVGFVAPGFRLALDETEVQETFEVPLAHVFDPANHVPRTRVFGDVEVELIDIPYGSRNIWGATAGMLLTFYRLLVREARR